MNSQIFSHDNTTAKLSPIYFWQHTLTPALPLFAEKSQLSTNKIRQIIPQISFAIIVQLAKKIDKKPLLQILPTINDLSWFAKTTNHQHFSQQSQIFSNISQQFFDNQSQYYLVLGDLLHKTDLTIDKLQPLFDNIVALSLLLLNDLIRQNHSPALYENWIKQQANNINQKRHKGLLLAIDYQPNETTLTDDEQQQINEQIHHYLKKAFIDLQSVEINATNPNNHPVFAKPTAKKPLPKWLQPLQKHWIATATALSMVVIGGTGFFTDTEQKPKENQIPKQKYHDVAIMKVASTPAVVASVPPAVETVKENIVDEKSPKDVEKHQEKQPPKVEPKETKKSVEKVKEKSKKSDKIVEKPNDKVEKKQSKKSDEKDDKKELKKSIKEKSEKTDKKSNKSEPKTEKKGDK